MIWDDFIDAEVQSKGPVPDGTHVGKIASVAVEQKPWDWTKGANNPEGLCLTVEVEVLGFDTVEKTIPCHWRGAIEELCRSARVEPPAKGEDWDEAELLDQVVSIETLLSVSTKGNEFVKVVRFKPTSQSNTPKPKPVKQTPAQRIDAETKADPDDIPF